jgi:hypothetical protein
MYPHPKKSVPKKYKMMMLDFATRYNLPEVCPSNPLVRRVGWICREKESEKLRWLKSDNQIAKYYVENNPEYNVGNGLLILTPVTFLNILFSLSIYLKKYSLPRLSDTKKGQKLS